MKNYDPNIRFATQKVAITFQCWDYKTTKVAHIGGNCKGLDVIETAVDHIFSELADEQDTNYPSLELINDNGEGLDCENDGCQDGVEWLKNMIVNAEIVSIKEQPVMKCASARAKGCKDGKTHEVI